MNNPQANSRPKSSMHKQGPNGRLSTGQSKHTSGPNNKGDLNADSTVQYQQGKKQLESDQRNEMLRENHDMTKEKKSK